MAERHGEESEMAQRPARSPAVFDRAFLIGTEEVTDVLLVRHAQQDVDFHTAPTGEIADPPLTAHGRQQARLLGEALSTLKVDTVFTSPLRRARETAGAIAGQHRLEAEVLDDLREVEIFRDMPQEMRAEDFLGTPFLEAVRQRMLNERSWDVYPFSEASYDFRKRAINAVETAIARSLGERIVVVCHGGVINAYVGHIIGSRYDMFFRPAHASISTVVAGEGRRVLRVLNETHHLRTGEGDFLSY
jgi:broad specificity phosphatase PhoE